MTLSPESIIAIVGIIISIPPAVIALWKLFRRKRLRRYRATGRDFELTDSERNERDNYRQLYSPTINVVFIPS
ncbi:hypothetical protein F4821DRAFT_236242 [Hypoxylon rubiginosum]|uniref:Uncharacterized protein n=1 Tax=Hypoxylon rubiginosum TaxID=110542 RepID=A0ACC0D3R5_9PEZI|nr:hypothetical protein F4821DRAFT_236242 [Hypoxylon rubiginosum]